MQVLLILKKKNEDRKFRTQKLIIRKKKNKFNFFFKSTKNRMSNEQIVEISIKENLCLVQDKIKKVMLLSKKFHLKKNSFLINDK